MIYLGRVVFLGTLGGLKGTVRTWGEEGGEEEELLEEDILDVNKKE